MPKTLSEFLVDLAYDVDKLGGYYNNRSNYIQGADLSESDKNLLMSGDTDAINAAIAAEGADATISDEGGGHIKLTKKSEEAS